MECDSLKGISARPIGRAFFCAPNMGAHRPGTSAPSFCGQLSLRTEPAVYTRAMLWVKSFHIVFVASWFAGLFYLPRIFVNLAMVPPGSDAERQRLRLMARKLMRFTHLLMVPAVVLGVWLWAGYGIGWGPGNGWMHAKLAVVLLVLGYHHACGVMLKKLEAGTNTRGHVWYRWFNELPVIMLVVAVCLVVVKPF